MKKELIAHKNPKSPISEIFRTLRTNIQFMNTKKKMTSLLITSTFPDEGKSWCASNLAVTFAQAGKKVVLIDADMRKGRQYSIFDVLPTPGLSNYLSDAEVSEDGVATERIESYVQETGVENLYLIASGDIPPNPSELLVSASMVAILNDLSKICDLVIIDGTPCELVTDSVILSRLVDSTVIVTAYKKTKKEALDRVIKNIQNVGGNIAGIVLNRMPITSKKYGEQYYYYGKNRDKIKKDRRKKTIDVLSDRVDQNIVKLEEEIKEAEKLQESFNEAFPETKEFVEENAIENNEFETNEFEANEFENNEFEANEFESNEFEGDEVENNEFGKHMDENEVVEEPAVENSQFANELEAIRLEKDKKSDEFVERTNEILRQLNEYIEKENQRK